MVSQKTIQVFDGVAGHSKSFYMGSDGTLLKRNTASGIMAKIVLFQAGSKLATVIVPIKRRAYFQFFDKMSLNKSGFLKD